MAFFYSLAGERIDLSPSTEDRAECFEQSGINRVILRSARTDRTGLATIRHQDTRHSTRIRDASVRSSQRRSSIHAERPTTAIRALPVYCEPVSGLRVVVTEEITIRFKPHVSETQQKRLLQAKGLDIVRENAYVARQYIVAPMRAVDQTQSLNIANALREADDLVEFSVPNFVSEYSRTARTNDRLLLRQWHLNNRGLDGARVNEDVRAFAAWDIVPGGTSDTVIAIIDDGVDIDHIDLHDNIWINPNASAPDKHGRNFFDDNTDPRPCYWQSPYHQMTGNDIHGTACAGVAAAVGNNHKGIAGIAYGCRILPVKIFGAHNLAANDQVADALRYAGQHAQILSCSWSAAYNADLDSAINDVVYTGRSGLGCLVFCATGNRSSNNVAFPARHAMTLGVGATNDRGERADYSNYGPGIDFVAPGGEQGRIGIMTTDVAHRRRGFCAGRQYTDTFTGTSAATPLAAGIAALVLSKRPDLRWNEVRDLLRSSADKINPADAGYDAQGYSLKYGYGRLNAYRALLQA